MILLNSNNREAFKQVCHLIYNTLLNYPILINCIQQCTQNYDIVPFIEFIKHRLPVNNNTELFETVFELFELWHWQLDVQPLDLNEICSFLEQQTDSSYYLALLLGQIEIPTISSDVSEPIHDDEHPLETHVITNDESVPKKLLPFLVFVKGRMSIMNNSFLQTLDIPTSSMIGYRSHEQLIHLHITSDELFKYIKQLYPSMSLNEYRKRLTRNIFEFFTKHSSEFKPTDFATFIRIHL